MEWLSALEFFEIQTVRVDVLGLPEWRPNNAAYVGVTVDHTINLLSCRPGCFQTEQTASIDIVSI